MDISSMNESVIEIRRKIQKGEIDINNQQPFFKNLIKALVYKLNRDFTCRDVPIPHYILNTGDDIMYLENKGQDASIEPMEVSNENYIYTVVPRCLVSLGGIEFLGDQLTSPYSMGKFQLDYDGRLMEFSAECRRMPFKMTVELKYYFDTMTDVLEYIQQVFSKAIAIQTFEFQYLGQMIVCSYQVPTGYDPQANIEFDGGTTDNKFRSLPLSFEIESNFPYFQARTVADHCTVISTYADNLKVYRDRDVILESYMTSYQYNNNGEITNEPDWDKLVVLYKTGIPIEKSVTPEVYEEVQRRAGDKPTPEPQPPLADFNFEVYGRTIILYNKSKDYVDCTWNVPNTLSENIYFLTPDMIKVEFRSAGTYIVKLTAKKPGYESSICEKKVVIV